MNDQPEDFESEIDRQRFEPKQKRSANGADPKQTFRPTPYVWRDPRLIPRRDFVGGNKHLIRKFLSATIAPGGLGKSTLCLADAVALACGKKLHGSSPNGKFRVWYWNGEDPHEEIERRIVAIMDHYCVSAADIGDRLAFNSGRDNGMEIIIGRQDKGGTVLAAPVEEALTEALIAGKFDVLVLDPFVSTHRVSENDNMAIDAIAKTLGRIADKTNCAIELIHHVRKTSGNEITVEDGRGASSLIAAARSVRVLNPMNDDEAKKAGVEVNRKGFYFRSDIGKANLAPPSSKATWFHLKSVQIDNGPLISVGADFVERSGGDSVGVVTAWDWPDPLEGVGTAGLRDAQAEIAKGQWRKDHAAQDWVGIPIAVGLKLNRHLPADKAKIKALIEIWLQTGALAVVSKPDDHRHKREFIEVGERA